MSQFRKGQLVTWQLMLLNLDWKKLHSLDWNPGWPVDEWPKEVLCLRSIFLPKEVYFWPWKKYKSRKKLIFRQNYFWITPYLAINFREIFYSFYIQYKKLQSCRHHLTLIFDKFFSAEFQQTIFYFFGIFCL